MGWLLFYLRIGLAVAWFFAATIVSVCMLVFRWKDPSMGAIFGRIVHWGGMKALGLSMRVEHQTRLYLNQPCVYVANHQSNLDVVTMGCMYPYRTVVIGKSQLKWVPLFGLFFKGSGMIMIDRENFRNSVSGLNKAKEAMLSTGASLWLFPEGTRNRGRSALLPFKKGPFHIAISAQVPVVPIVHQYLYSYCDMANKRIHSGQELRMCVLEPIETKGLTLEDMPQLMNKVRARMIETMQDPELRFPVEMVKMAKDGSVEAGRRA